MRIDVKAVLAALILNVGWITVLQIPAILEDPNLGFVYVTAILLTIFAGFVSHKESKNLPLSPPEVLPPENSPAPILNPEPELLEEPEPIQIEEPPEPVINIDRRKHPKRRTAD